MPEGNRDYKKEGKLEKKRETEMMREWIGLRA